jgi:NAD(P)-dependent dehydrogenase (short-subunit alcohol dehydrogenase family)
MESMLKNKVALVTGAASGIGKATAELFASEGASVVVADLKEEAGRETVSAIESNGGNAAFVQLDQSKPGTFQSVVDEAERPFGGIDVLCNIAGVTASRKITEITEDSWDFVTGIDLKGMFFLTQEVFVRMRDRGHGKIVNVASIAALRGGRSSDASYSAAKAGVLNLTKCFALQGAQHGINVNAVCPGNIYTPMSADLAWSKRDPKDYIPMGRYGTPEDVAGVMLFLASDLADYVVGESINISGGLYV